MSLKSVNSSYFINKFSTLLEQIKNILDIIGSPIIYILKYSVKNAPGKKSYPFSYPALKFAQKHIVSYKRAVYPLGRLSATHKAPQPTKSFGYWVYPGSFLAPFVKNAFTFCPYI